MLIFGSFAAPLRSQGRRSNEIYVPLVPMMLHFKFGRKYQGNYEDHEVKMFNCHRMVIPIGHGSD